MLPGSDRIAEPGIVGQVYKQIRPLRGDKSARQASHQVFIANKGCCSNPVREVECPRPISRGKAVAQGRDGRKPGDKRSKGQVLAKGKQDLLVIITRQTALRIDQEGTVEGLEVGGCGVAAKAPGAKDKRGILRQRRKDL